jgi:hypothetical protein
METEFREVFSGNKMCKYGVPIQRLETVSASISRVNVMSDTSAHCICTHKWLLKSCVLVHKQVKRNSGQSQAASQPSHHIRSQIHLLYHIINLFFLPTLSKCGGCWVPGAI